MRNLEFEQAAFEDLAWWVDRDRKQALKIIKLIQATQRDPSQTFFGNNINIIFMFSGFFYFRISGKGIDFNKDVDV